MCGARCSIRRPLCSAGEIGASFAQQRYCLSMAAEASEIQGHVTVAINLVRSAPCIEEPAYRRCISIETGLVPFLVRLNVSDRSHDRLTKSRYYKTAANLCARGCVVRKKMWPVSWLASSKTLESSSGSGRSQTTLQTRTKKRFSLSKSAVQRPSAPDSNLRSLVGTNGQPLQLRELP